MSQLGMTGRIVGLQRSAGGVPKLAVDRALVGENGMEGDQQRHRKFHGGPMRALCLYSAELIDALAAEGHAIAPGVVGENVTTGALDWAVVQPGVRIRLGAAEIEVTSYAAPCKTIAHAFANADFIRISQKHNPGWSRVYVRVVRAAEIAVGDDILVLGARDI